MTQRTSAKDQAFLRELDTKLRNTAERLRSNLDATVYKHAVLGLIFLKYVSDSFDLRREELLIRATYQHCCLRSVCSEHQRLEFKEATHKEALFV